MGKNKKYSFLLALFLAAHVGYAQVDQVVKLPFPEQYQAFDDLIDSLVTLDTTRAQKILSQLEQNAVQTKVHQTWLNYMRAKIRYQYTRTLGAEDQAEIRQLFKETEIFLESIDAKKYPVIAALIHFQLGNALDYTTYQYKSAFSHFLRSYDLFKNIPLNQFPYRYYTQYAIALAYFQFGDADKAIELAEEVEALFPQKNHISIYNVNLIGLCYMTKNNFPKAITSFKWIFDNSAFAEFPETWRGIASGNIGNVYYKAKALKKAIPYLKTALEITQKNGIQENTASSALLLSDIYIKLNKPDEARIYLNIVDGIKELSQNLPGMLKFHNTYVSYYKLINNPQKALYYLELARDTKDSMDVYRNRKLKYNAEIELKNEKEENLQKIFALKIQRETQLRNTIILFSLLSLSVLGLWFSRRKLKYENLQKQLQIESQSLQIDLSKAKEKLNEFTYSLIAKNALLEQTQAENETISLAYEKLKAQNSIAISEDEKVNTLMKLTNESFLGTDQGWLDFTTLFNSVFPGYFIQLKALYPKITNAEIRFMAVSKLNLNARDTATLLGITPDGVRKIKTRLSAKIEEELNMSIDDFMRI